MADPALSLSATPGPLEFEQPLTERMRTFLRVELLYHQARFHFEDTTELSARAAVGRLLEILTILGRGDVRAEVAKELERQGEMLASFARQPGVDPARLQGFMDDLRRLQTGLMDCGPNFMTPLKECDFLNNIKHRSTIPGGTCTFDLPDYAYWLRLPYEERSKQYRTWLEVIRPLCDAIVRILWLIREANEPEEHLAANGLYQLNLERGAEPNLVRVVLPPGGDIYPEISAGKHRFTVRFVRWRGTHQRPAQVERDVRFLLTLC